MAGAWGPESLNPWQILLCRGESRPAQPPYTYQCSLLAMPPMGRGHLPQLNA